MAGRIEVTGLFAAVPGGQPVAQQNVTVYTPGTTTKASLVTDKTGGSAAANPFPTDALGNGTVFAAFGDYDLFFSVGAPGSGYTVRKTVSVREDGSFVSQIQSLTPGAGALAIDASLGSIVKVAPTGNVTPTTVTNLQVGQRLIIDFVSDGSHTFAFPAVCKFAGGAAATASSTSGFRDRYEFEWDGTNLIEVCRSIAIH